MQRSWRWVYLVSTSLSMLFSILQLCLIFRVNTRIGISDLAFALGESLPCLHPSPFPTLLT